MSNDKARAALRLLDEMNAYFSSGNAVTPGSRKSIPTCEWVELHAALLAALAQPAQAEPRCGFKKCPHGAECVHAKGVTP